MDNGESRPGFDQIVSGRWTVVAVTNRSDEFIGHPGKPGRVIRIVGSVLDRELERLSRTDSMAHALPVDFDRSVFAPDRCQRLARGRAPGKVRRRTAPGSELHLD